MSKRKKRRKKGRGGRERSVRRERREEGVWEIKDREEGKRRKERRGV